MRISRSSIHIPAAVAVVEEGGAPIDLLRPCKEFEIKLE
jgi:hypothetical protein